MKKADGSWTGVTGVAIANGPWTVTAPDANRFWEGYPALGFCA
jgi:hypothetical protein